MAFENYKPPTAGNVGVGSNVPFVPKTLQTWSPTQPAPYIEPTPYKAPTTPKPEVLGTNTNKPSGSSGPSDADYDAVGVARGDRGGYDRVMKEIESRKNQQQSQWAAPDGSQWGNPNDYYAEIDKTANEVMSYLSQNEGLLNQNKLSADQQAEADYQSNLAQLGLSKTEAQTSLASQERQGQTRSEDALAQAVRLYNQMQMGGRQRFGGASSAGQAYSEIQGAELQRQQGQTNRQTNEFMQQVQEQGRLVDEKYNAGKMQVMQAVQGARAKIQQDFTNALMQITNMRGAAEAEKGKARLNALMSVRDQMNQVNMQEKTFQQQLEAMREQARLNVSSYNQTTGSATQAGTTALNNLQPANASFSQIGKGQTLDQPQYIGSIQKSVKGKDELGRFIYDDGTKGWGGFLNG